MAKEPEGIEGQSVPAPADAAGSQADQDAKTLAWAEEWLSAERLRSYLDDCGGDVNLALELYEWNFRLGQALLHDISCLEVALRNAYDRLMRERWQGEAH